MLLVRVELWPSGDYRRAKTVASMVIGNTSDLADSSDYEITASENGADHLGIAPSEAKFSIKSHVRKQTVWALLARAAAEAVKCVKP